MASTKNNGNDDVEEVLRIAGVASDVTLKGITTMKALKELVHHTSSTTLSPWSQGAGQFSKLEMTGDREFHTVQASEWQQLLQIELDDPFYASLPSQQFGGILYWMNKRRLFQCAPASKESAWFTYQPSGGQLIAVAIMARPVEGSKVEFVRCAATASFALQPDTLLVKEEGSDFLSSWSNQRLIHNQRGFTQQDLTAVLQCMAGLFGFMNGELTKAISS
jgi:hypothetical protein